jgi:peptidoglycan/LPS O-acetylase OafA/YrhL
MDRAAPASATCPAAEGLGYRRWLDGLRGVAILLVLLCHLSFLRGGFLGVDVFFVLSGFLITTLLVDEWARFGSISLPRFYARRALRLLPAFWVLLLVCWVTATYLPKPEAADRRREIVLAACYVTNWPAIHHAPLSVLGHTWSLAVEEQFYLVWPLLLYAMLRSGLSHRAIVGLVVGGVAASALLRLALILRYERGGLAGFDNLLRLYMGLDTRADVLLVGCLAALLTSWGIISRSRRWVTIYSAAALVAATAIGFLIARTPDAGQSRYYYGLFTAVALGIAVVLVRLVVAPCRVATTILESRLLVGIGRISYALYLFHLPIKLSLARYGWSFHVQSTLVVVLSFVAATCSYFVIERPCLRVKARLRKPASLPGRPIEFAKAA